VRARASIHIKRDPAAVFARVSDFASHSSWRPEVLSTRTSPGALQPGSTIIQRVSLYGRELEVELEITEMTAPERIALRARGPYRGRGSFSLRPDAGGTRLSVTATVELDGIAGLGEESIREKVEANARQSLLRLKEQLEAE